jgi:hypothetical protein
MYFDLTRNWRKLSKEEPRVLYSSRIITRMVKLIAIRWAWEKEKCIQNFGLKPTGEGVSWQT